MIILAGGGGLRLWPLSRQDCPKQFLKLTGERDASLFIETILRCHGDDEGFIKPEDIYVVTSRDLECLVQAELCQAGLERIIQNIICEPERRNTAPAIALAGRYLYETGRDADEVLAILPADHAVSDIPLFRARLREGADLASKGAIVTLGVVPTHPATGYGYIEVESLDCSTGQPVKSFTEKPDYETACRYLAANRYYWNAGILIASIATLMDAWQTHAPQIDRVIRHGYHYAQRHFAQMPDISMDYAVLEKASNVLMLPLQASWSDLGCWDNIYEMLAKDEDANALQCRYFQKYETQRSLIWSETGRHIAAVGVEDLIIVDTPDVLAIIRRGESQSVRELAFKRDVVPSGAVASRSYRQATVAALTSADSVELPLSIN